jgi:alpha-D-xyloside xylohydrolase
MYGFLWNNPAVGRVELAENGTHWVAESSKQIDYIVIAGNDYGSLMQKYADVTGHAPQVPTWAAGFWQCKLRYTSQEEILSVAREYKRRNIPLSVIVVDFFHWTRFGDWDWDKTLWPDPEGMVRELEEMGIKLMVSVWPAVNPRSRNFPYLKEKGLLVETMRGHNSLFPFTDTYDNPPVYLHYYDATNPKARDFLWNTVKKNYHDVGVEVFWLDACEPEMNPLQHENLTFHLGSGAEVANIYPLLHEKGFYEGMRDAGQQEVLNLCRSGWSGSQRYGVAIWSGDVDSDWEAFRAQIKAGLNIGMSGIPWWTTDIGGFWMGDVEDPDFRELLVRWFQFGLFSPLFRLHGNRAPRPEDIVQSGADNEIWSFGEEIYSILKHLIEIREKIRPYIMEQMNLASETGCPLMRPLFFDYPDEQECYTVEDEYLFGPDIIVAPVVHSGARKRSVYLPEGAAWVNGWSGEYIPSGAWVTADAPLETVPVFLREGSTLDLME